MGVTSKAIPVFCSISLSSESTGFLSSSETDGQSVSGPEPLGTLPPHLVLGQVRGVKSYS